MFTISNQLTISMKPAEQNLAAFLNWTIGKNDAHYREMIMRGQLSRQEIARECGFAKSVLLQNPRVKDALQSLEAQLRERGVLPSQAVVSDGAELVVVGNQRANADKVRLKRLESENASLRAEVTQLRADLERYRLMDNVLCSTGRLPR